MSAEGVVRWAHRLQTELDLIHCLLAEQPMVKRAAVFGSTSAGQTHEWTNLDLLVLEESQVPFIERVWRLARLIRTIEGISLWLNEARRYPFTLKANTEKKKCRSEEDAMSAPVPIIALRGRG